MSSQGTLLDASTELLQSLGRFAQMAPRQAMWQELLNWLVARVESTGARLLFADPALPALHAGQLDDPSQAWLAGQDAPSLWWPAGAQLRQLAGGQLLVLGVAPDGERPLLSMALSFPVERVLPPPECELLHAALQALATAAAEQLALQETQERLNRFRHLYEVGQVITSTLDLDQVLRQSTARVAEVLRAEASTLLLVDEPRRELVFKIPAGPAEQILLEQRMPIDKGVAGWAATQGQPLVIPDVQADTRFYDDIDRLTGYRTRSIMAVPMQVKGRIIGVVEVINKLAGGAFTADDLQWLSILAPLVAIAIDNARLFANLREERDRIIAAEENVRHELARNLHDGPAQILAAMILNIDMARRQLAARPKKMAAELDLLESLAQEANHGVRDLLFSLRPISLEDHGLVVALAQLVDRIQPHAAYQLHLDVLRLPPGTIDPKVAGTLFVIVQEALNNIQKHARARHVWIRIGASEHKLWVEIADDGLGFDVAQVDASYAQLNSFGLLNMRERARLIDGQTQIISPPPDSSHGTVVRVDVPLSLAYPVAG